MSHAHRPTRSTTAAAVMRRIGQRRPLAHPRPVFLCAPCQVTWRGDEADCWSCGRPASTEHGHPGAALHALLTAVHPTTAAAVRPDTGRAAGDARIGRLLQQAESVIHVDEDRLGRLRDKLFARLGDVDGQAGRP